MVPGSIPARPLRPAAPIAPSPRRTPLREPVIPAHPIPLHAAAAPEPVPPPTADTPASCDACDAICCRLTVLVMPGDRVPEHLTDVTPEGLHVMARDEDGWCVAIDSARMCCSIYELRPAICRKFAMDGPYCRDVRRIHATHYPRAIDLTLC